MAPLIIRSRMETSKRITFSRKPQAEIIRCASRIPVNPFSKKHQASLTPHTHTPPASRPDTTPMHPITVLSLPSGQTGQEACRGTVMESIKLPYCSAITAQSYFPKTV